MILLTVGIFLILYTFGVWLTVNVYCANNTSYAAEFGDYIGVVMCSIVLFAMGVGLGKVFETDMFLRMVVLGKILWLCYAFIWSLSTSCGRDRVWGLRV